MVCIYCGADTQVINSRLQKRRNHVWRRRRCVACNAVFSSTEEVVYAGTLVVQLPTSHIIPFNRDKLFLSIYDSCRHRNSGIPDATALTDTVIASIIARAQDGLVGVADIITITNETLKHFDAAAATHYAAFHPHK